MFPILISFELKGSFATFRKPDVCSKDDPYLSYIYPPIPSIAGILGAIVGLSGYSSLEDGKSYPEYYSKLKDCSIGIEDKNPLLNRMIVGYINKHGYAYTKKSEFSDTLMIKEQILINPKWKIYVFCETENEYLLKLINMLKNKNTVFTPYLGKNEFLATINNFEILKSWKIIKDLPQKTKFKTIFPIIPKNVKLKISYNQKIYENYPYSLKEDLNYKTCVVKKTIEEIDSNEIDNSLGKIVETTDNYFIYLFNL